MKFEVKGYKYKVDEFGVITQLDHRPFFYDADYAAIYNKPEYQHGTDILQALRLGFALGAHGKPINSLLDVGYGNGSFLKYIEPHIPFRYGFDITGVPLSGAYRMPELVKADAYTLWDVLEHFPDCSFLSSIQCETLFVSLPYCHFHTQGKEWFENYHHLKPNEHIRHFCPWSLSAFMRQYGWREVANSDHENIIRHSKHGLQNIFSMAFKKSK